MISDGEWFGVPLKPDGWAVGRVVGVHRAGFAAYFFGPARDELPTIDDLAGLGSAEAVLAESSVSNLGFSHDGWTRIGQVPAEGGWPGIPDDGSASGSIYVQLRLSKLLNGNEFEQWRHSGDGESYIRDARTGV